MQFVVFKERALEAEKPSSRKGLGMDFGCSTTDICVLERPLNTTFELAKINSRNIDPIN